MRFGIIFNFWLRTLVFVQQGREISFAVAKEEEQKEEEDKKDGNDDKRGFHNLGFWGV